MSNGMSATLVQMAILSYSLIETQLESGGMFSVSNRNHKFELNSIVHCGIHQGPPMSCDDSISRVENERDLMLIMLISILVNNNVD